jgi:hypothetical protein
MRKENNDLLFHIVIVKVHAFVTMCYEGIYAFSRLLGFVNGMTVRQLP